VTETNPSLTTPSDPTSTPDALREELRIGVRMLQALDAQFKRAESLIQSEEEAARRVEEAIERLSRRFESIETGSVVAAGVDAGEIERTATAAVERITSAADDAARQLHDRLDRFVALDARLDELDATLKTVERRLERLPVDTPAAPTEPSSTTSSGSLSVEPRIPAASLARTTGTTLDDSNPELAATIRLQLLIDRGEEVRRDLRQDLEAICTASATLVEIVEQASRTERTLRETLDTATSRPVTVSEDGETSTAAWSVASILRRLADEFDANDATTPAVSTSTPQTSTITRSIAAITPTTPIELDVSTGDGNPVRREPLVAPDQSINAITAS
jgi:DNA repair exonuclease SbcCD ATPase subunit